MDTVDICLRTGRTMQRCCEAIWKRKMKLLRLRTLVDPADNKKKIEQYFFEYGYLELWSI